MADPPHLRWGIITTGKICTWFVNDILTPGSHRTATHSIAAIGASSLDKARDFWTNTVTTSRNTPPALQPKLYGSYEEVFNDSNLDIVYIGSPHSFHLKHCLSAINAGKNILCEKPLTLNTSQALALFSAAEQKNVFLMEAMWTRFFPAFRQLHTLLHTEKVLGDIVRVWCDFGLDIDVRNLPKDSRYKDASLGAGSLLDLGVYSLTWGLMGLGMIADPTEADTTREGESKWEGDTDWQEDADLELNSSQSLVDGVEVTTTMILRDRRTGAQAICTSTTEHETSLPDRAFARIEGRNGYITVHGETAASPDMFVVRLNGQGEKEYKFEKPGRGYCWEADAVAGDLAAGRGQSLVMPWGETLRVMRIMDGVRRRGGARFSVDEW